MLLKIDKKNKDMFNTSRSIHCQTKSQSKNRFVWGGVNFNISLKEVGSCTALKHTLKCVFFCQRSKPVPGFSKKSYRNVKCF